ncbi:sulfurtransferase TusA family protein [Paracoccus sp. SM22M-07]|mgnify:CR=1 FL=1|uniref:sulfurtransferase TusA family protein n=1 Tax=Paracoccus sp. SM22M-07 TaxID=1520813 RepID=UPI00091EB6DA|nr:sulfurtransferase TusA family protein [Paracoccus sp. SM22M-07]OJH44079.1 hypothetical protein IE00_12820 [Paracoccus sp. SM22M-07]
MTHVDARGLLCPLPVLRLRKALMAVAPGDLVVMVASDPMAVVDVPHFCGQSGHAMVAQRDLGNGAFEFTVQRGRSVPPATGGPTPEDI